MLQWANKNSHRPETFILGVLGGGLGVDKNSEEKKKLLPSYNIFNIASFFLEKKFLLFYNFFYFYFFFNIIFSYILEKIIEKFHEKRKKS